MILDDSNDFEPVAFEEVLPGKSRPVSLKRLAIVIHRSFSPNVAHVKVTESIRNQDNRPGGAMQNPAHFRDSMTEFLIVLQTTKVHDSVEALVGKGERLRISD